MKKERSPKATENGRRFRYGVGHLVEVADSLLVGTIVRRMRLPTGGFVYAVEDHEGAKTYMVPEERIKIILCNQEPHNGFKYEVGLQVRTPGVGLYATIDYRAVSPSEDIWYGLADIRSKVPYLVQEEDIDLL